ncbi:LOW QUALITY PROTEIN: kelch-like protein 24 [Haliotis rubra]|uniref:LOW QUALITY PROTEIN: kelch-like protein 24 n=1 Tax=Haliotis rubra TaxID=36100 RepID=UPI001EE4F883|nr:LOW QUALITY PROTEIN: kelch-like protein 24 [Haliotis rubra]
MMSGEGGGDAHVAEEDTQSSYHSQEQTVFLIDNMQKLRLDSSYTDIVISIEGCKFPCHKIVLAAGSPYFKSMFSSGMEESFKDVIDIKQIDASVFEHVLHFIYTGNVSMTGTIVQELFSQAHLFQVLTLVELCVQYFQQNMNDGNCLAAMTLADIHAHKPLYNFAKKFACEHFPAVFLDDDFSKLSMDCIVDLLRDRRLNCTSEEQVFDAAVKWLESDSERRLSYKFQVLECVKFPLISQSYLMDVVVKTGHLSDEDKGKELLEEAVLYHTVPSRRHMLPSYQITPRYSFQYFESAILLGGRLMDGLSNDVEYYRSDTKEFCSLKALPFKKRNEFAACAIGDEIYVSGGLRSSEFWKYDPTFETWLRGANMLHARRRHAMSAVDDLICVLGGFDEDSVLASIEMWDKKSNKWEEGGHLITGVENMGFVSYGKKIYLFGGKNNEEMVTNTVQCYDTVTKTCSVLQKGLPANDMCLTACLLNNQIYVVGLEGVFRYSPASDTWDILPDMSYPRDFVSLCVLDEKLYAFGGRRRGAKDNLYSDVIEYYDPESTRWFTSGNIPVPMYSYGCVRVFLCQQRRERTQSQTERVPHPPC